MNRSLIAALVLIGTASASAVDYAQIKNLFSQKCYACHAISKGKTKGDLALDTPEELGKVIKPDGLMIPGAPEKSKLLDSVKLPDDDDDVMPPKGKNRLTPEEVTLLTAWIKEGASIAGGGGAPAPAPTAAPAAPAPGAPAAAGVETWTSSDGKAIQATFMGMKGPDALLKMASNGEVFQVPMSRLSEESQAKIKAASGMQ
ncbi:MAG: c-type cytochrome domain-containing protein [Verrucomicrobiota bacterium]